ncbi:MAG: PAS domain S-box-containing protein [Flavobacteriaceae bacterium]|jgi:PAS domain S-box-containing protein
MCINTQAQLYTFKNFSHRDGLTMGAINCMSQSDDGYLWLGTDGAELIRFDGKEFEEINFGDDNNNHHYRNLFFDGDDILFSSQYKGFFRYSRQSKKITSLLSKKHTIGDRLYVFSIASTYYFVGTRGIVSKKNGYEKLLKSFDQTEPLELYQVINADGKTLLMTSSGNFSVSLLGFSSLHSWFGMSENDANAYRYGYLQNDKLTLFDKSCKQWAEIILNEDGQLFSINKFNEPSQLVEDDPVISFSYNKYSGAPILLTKKGQLFSLKERELSLLVHNLPEPLRNPSSVLADLNGDYWVSSDIKGIYKVSKEPFTGVKMHSILTSDEISFIYQASDRRVFISTFSGETHLLENSRSNSPVSFDFQVSGMTTVGNDNYLATDEGIKLYTSGGVTSIKSVIEMSNSISFIYEDEGRLWYGIRGRGLHYYDLEKKQKHQVKTDVPIPGYIYTAQVSADHKKIYFGTNNGVIRYDKSRAKFSQVKFEASKYGGYSGVSAIDTFGNMWFSLEKGLLVITPKKTHVIRTRDHLETNLIFTLNADKFGNIILGTNKGLTILKVNERGLVIKATTYDGESGYYGYESHMRSQFQRDNRIYMGTVEGLFAIDTELLEDLKRPLRPIIFDISNVGLVDNTDSENQTVFQFKFQVNNPKSENIYYRYRVRERSMEWSYLVDEDVIQIRDLANGTYTLEVCATHDGKEFSPSSLHKFTAELPFWKSSSFIIGMIALIILLNIFLLTYGRKHDSSRFLSTKDTEVNLRMTPTTLLYSTLIVPSSQIGASLLNEEFPLNLGGTLTIGFILLGLYLFSLNAKKSGQIYTYKYLLAIALYTSTAFFLWEIFSTNILPFHIIAIVLLTSIAPFVLSNVRVTIIYGLMIFLAASTILLLVDNPTYPKSYFIISIVAALSMMVLNSYLRYNSLEKLLFVSGIINQGNFPVIAYRRDGTVTYVSENIKNFIDIAHDDLLNSNISLLNKFSLFDESYRNVDVTKGLSEGDKYLTPMTDSDQGVSWMEWSYKEFSENTRVIIGQDVSERIELQNTYELLVQNVEDLIYTVDVKGYFLFVNKAFIEKLGYSKEELIGSHSAEFVVEKHKAEVQKHYGDHFKEQKASSYLELPIQAKTGEVIWIGQHVNTIYAPGVKSFVNGYIALARDITEIREQQQVIKSQRDDITSSINYARKIQLNLLPHVRHFAANFSDHFLMYRPKDIVSGDFYWIHKIEGKQVVILADCTGHGVPGAFMTLLGLNMLNSVVLEAQLTEPGMILNELDKRLEDYFQKQIATEKMNDGMEITICVIDDDSDEISYACAGSRFLIHGSEGFTMFKGNNEHIGDTKREGFNGYVTQYTELTPNDTIFLFTDGFQDQFGGVNNKKFSFRRLLELVESNANMALPEQRKMIEAEFDTWKGNQVQTDDVTMIGLRRNQS